MEEHQYPKFEEEENLDTCKGPITVVSAASTGRKGTSLSNDGMDNIDWDRLPSLGPFSEEEALARIAQAEADLNDPSKWIRIDDINTELKKLHPWL